MKPRLKIGSTIWRFDENRRVYPPTPKGRLWSDSGPIYREYWRPVEITGETSRSWITAFGKAPKAGAHYPFAFTEKEVEDYVWVNGNRHKVASAVGRLADADKLREIAAIIGYSP